MILNELLTRQNVFTKISLSDGQKELPKALKVKIMRVRMAYNKIRKAFDSEVQEFVDELMTDEFRNLQQNNERSEQEEKRYQELSRLIDSEYQEFLIQKGKEETSEIDDSFTVDEYSDILDVNSSKTVEINGTSISAVDFMEIVYELFVKE